MKIAIDASRYNHAEATGVEWYSWFIINNLIKQFDNNNSSNKNKSKNNYSYSDNLTLNGSYEIILYSRSLIETNNFINKNYVVNKVIHGRFLWTLFYLSREIKKNPPDVLFVPSHVLPLFLPKRSVITIHDVAFKYLKKSYSFFQYHYLNWSTKYAVKRADQIIVPSKATAKDLIELFDCPKNKISVIPHGFETKKVNINLGLFKSSEALSFFNLSPDSKYFLFIGRLESKKNLVRLVKAFNIFSKNNPDYKLILAGKQGLGFKEILSTVNNLSLLDKVIMPGYISEEEKAILFKYAKAFVFPSLYEGFGLPLLEAFSYNKAVICSNLSSLPEVGGKAALYIDPYDIEDIARGLKEVNHDDKALASQSQLKLFSWSEAARKTAKVLF